MKLSFRALAFVYGFFLMYFVYIWFTGFMAARQISPEYFGYFATYGRVGKDAAHAVLSVALHLVPSLLLLGAGVYLAVMISTPDRRAIGVTAILGSAFSYMFWLFYFAIQDQRQTQLLSATLASYIQAPWWAWPAMAAPALGLAFAYALLPKASRARTGA